MEDVSLNNLAIKIVKLVMVQIKIIVNHAEIHGI